MVADANPPLTNDELLALINVDGFYRFPASLDDYWNLLAEAQYRADYYDHHIIATIRRVPFTAGLLQNSAFC